MCKRVIDNINMYIYCRENINIKTYVDGKLSCELYL